MCFIVVAYFLQKVSTANELRLTKYLDSFQYLQNDLCSHLRRCKTKSFRYNLDQFGDSAGRADCSVPRYAESKQPHFWQRSRQVTKTDRGKWAVVVEKRKCNLLASYERGLGAMSEVYIDYA